MNKLLQYSVNKIVTNSVSIMTAIVGARLYNDSQGN